ncbi:uncharacterized protein LOC131146512 [Malania oleifera]|uniref:uncharacterized protein LOC131146512 n=1 Tax=Malania oleifera TaxID=397392 RepID=UPI0025ADB558|nr:uncharacterized protein LOC131146512 [Malania oleifera]
MEHPWRHRPIQGNVCPICSITHFPFCPPPFPVDQNPIFPLETDHSLRRPGFDPRGSVALPGLNPTDGFGEPRSWDRNHNLDRDYHGQFQLQPQSGGPTMPNGIYWDSFVPYNRGGDGFVSGGDRNTKRMRVDEVGAGGFLSEYNQNPARSAEDERRLKLIRDHGVVAGGLMQGGANSDAGFKYETKGYFQGGSVSGFGRSFVNADVVDYGKFDDLRGSRSDMAPKPPVNTERNSFQDPGSGSNDKKRPFGRHYLQSNTNGFLPDVDRHIFGNMGGDKDAYLYSHNGELRHSHHEQAENHLHSSLHGYGHDGFSSLNVNSVEQGWQNQGMAVRHGTDWDDPNQHPPQHVSRLNSEVYDENYGACNFQRDQPGDLMSTKEPQYSHPCKWQVKSGSSGLYPEQSSSIPLEDCGPSSQVPHRHDFSSAAPISDERQQFEVNTASYSNSGSIGHQKIPEIPHYAPLSLNREGGYSPIPTGTSMGSGNVVIMQGSGGYGVPPPLPTSPPPPFLGGPLGQASSDMKAIFSSSKASSPLFPISSGTSALVASSCPPVPEAHSFAKPYFHNKSHLHSSGFIIEETQAIHQTSSKLSRAEGQPFPLKQLSFDKPKFMDASHLFRQPHRATRPEHIVIILRGLPGSGKSYLAKMLRDLEVENGGNAPRIHSMDDYFMTEVEKVEESEVSVRGKKPVMKKVMEYCYEPEMEEAYRSSMLKAFKKTLEEGVFSFVIVDDRNLRVADFAQFWAIAKRSCYEVYLLEATYKDPAGCAARNVHGFTLDSIQKMAGEWEDAPSLYWQLDIKSLFHGDDLKESGIQEVDMDMEDGDFDGVSALQERNSEKIAASSVEDSAPYDSTSDGRRWDAERDHPAEVKGLGRSKWSDDLEENDTAKRESVKGSLNALSGLIQAYGKRAKSVHWGDQVAATGFSIGAAKKTNTLALVIGPGSGYNLKSNPLCEEEKPGTIQTSGESKRHSIFQERLRAERESFKAVFDRRRQRIGLEVDEE